MAKITFSVEAQTVFGDSLYIVGNNSALGNWDPHKGLTLSTNSSLYPNWRASVDIECMLLKYKYVIIKKVLYSIV
jgi:alpha-amylase